MNWLKRKLQRLSPRKPLAIEGLPKLKKGHFFRVTARSDSYKDYPLALWIMKRGLFGSRWKEVTVMKYHEDSEEMAKEFTKAAVRLLEENTEYGADTIALRPDTSLCGDYVSSD